MRRALFTTSFDSSVSPMTPVTLTRTEPQGRLTMRVLLGTAIALPIAAIFCLAYLTLLALEALRDAT